MDQASGPRMPRIKKLVLRDLVRRRDVQLRQNASIVEQGCACASERLRAAGASAGNDRIIAVLNERLRRLPLIVTTLNVLSFFVISSCILLHSAASAALLSKDERSAFGCSTKFYSDFKVSILLLAHELEFELGEMRRLP
jgi:hypothetical protein